jgi:hypothetical protein
MLSIVGFEILPLGRVQRELESAVRRSVVFADERREKGVAIPNDDRQDHDNSEGDDAPPSEPHRTTTCARSRSSSLAWRQNEQ